MKDHELKDALRLITKVQAESKMEPDQWDRLQKAKRELMAVAESGKLDRQRVLRAVQLIAEVLMNRLTH
jgi:hypothetical protein